MYPYREKATKKQEDGSHLPAKGKGLSTNQPCNTYLGLTAFRIMRKQISID